MIQKLAKLKGFTFMRNIEYKRSIFQCIKHFKSCFSKENIEEIIEYLQNSKLKLGTLNFLHVLMF